MLDHFGLSAGQIDQAYGYGNEGGDWPQYKEGDMEAATRAALLLFAVAEDEGAKSITLYFEEEGLSVEVGNRKVRELPTFVDLNDCYSAEVQMYGVKVGCQTIPYSAVQEVLDKAKELKYIK